MPSRASSENTLHRKAASGQNPRPQTPENSRPTLAELQTTPLNPKISTRRSLSAEPSKGAGLDPHRIELGDEMAEYWAKMAVKTFLDEHVPGGDPDEQTKSMFHKFDGEMLDKLEFVMASELIKGVQSVFQCNADNTLVAKDTADWPDNTDAIDRAVSATMRPDVCIYSTDDDHAAPYTLTAQELAGRKYSEERKQKLARTRWGSMVVPIELKSDISRAPFHFGNSRTEETEKKIKARGQIADYATRIMQRQHRLFLFMIVICKREARFLRWDRSGAIVTDAFDFVKNPEPLHTFFYRLSKMTREQHGYDPTVVPADADEIALMESYKDKLPQDEYLRKCLNDAMERGWPIQKNPGAPLRTRRTRLAQLPRTLLKPPLPVVNRRLDLPPTRACLIQVHTSQKTPV
ncbi:predicted protein [Postia placenta Mad-698-R]|nr:predicted protein [Postia placenta Mad-698-R]